MTQIHVIAPHLTLNKIRRKEQSFQHNMFTIPRIKYPFGTYVITKQLQKLHEIVDQTSWVDLFWCLSIRSPIICMLAYL